MLVFQSKTLLLSIYIQYTKFVVFVIVLKIEFFHNDRKTFIAMRQFSQSFNHFRRIHTWNNMIFPKFRTKKNMKTLLLCIVTNVVHTYVSTLAKIKPYKTTIFFSALKIEIYFNSSIIIFTANEHAQTKSDSLSNSTIYVPTCILYTLSWIYTKRNKNFFSPIIFSVILLQQFFI